MYELTNRLGNVLSVISDKLLPNTTYDPNLLDNRNGTRNHLFTADVVSTTDYYPFGMNMAGRSLNTDEYRYGFNGKEKDSEWGNQDYGMCIYDTRVARFLSVDPLSPKFPWYTPYQFAGNTPIQAIDLDELEVGFAQIGYREITGVLTVSGGN
jgi:RHS repeat-associated protein